MNFAILTAQKFVFDTTLVTYGEFGLNGTGQSAQK
jgi:hypothetical protein